LKVISSGSHTILRRRNKIVWGFFIHYRRHDQANGAGVPPIGQRKSHCKRVAVGSVLLAYLLYLHIAKNVGNGVKIIFCVLFDPAVLEYKRLCNSKTGNSEELYKNSYIYSSVYLKKFSLASSALKDSEQKQA
jgi:hypothetical protein